jgi:hypothetical protein
MSPPPTAFPHALDNPAQTRRLEVARATGRGRVIGSILASAIALSLAGCQATESQSPAAAEGQALFGEPTSTKTPAGQPVPSAWSIVLVAYRGPDQDEAARLGLGRTRSAGGLTGAYTERRGNSTVIAFGRYDRPDSAEAQADLKRIRAMEVEGGHPFDGAVLAPPEGQGTGRMPELDLRQVRATYGIDALYSLQIAAYGRDDRKPPKDEKERSEFVRMAEDAAAQLRREGHQAFYFHGPNMSLVTIGVFGPDDYDPQYPERRSSRLRAAQEAHPNNLLNGKGIRVRIRGVSETSPNAWKMATSFLIAIPNE